MLGVDPKIDYVFKRLFGSEQDKPLLIDLLNAVLGSSLEEPIDDVEILNPFTGKEDLNDKLAILDIKARDRKGRLYNIEMQMAAFGIFPKRVLYYWSRVYSRELKEGEPYGQLQPVISISFVNGRLFPGDEFHLEFSLLARQNPSVVFCPDLAIHVIELPKFPGRLEDLRSSLDRWCYFLRRGEFLEPANLPVELRTPSIQRAVEVLQMVTQTEIEREKYEARYKAIHDRISELDWARREMQQARDEGIQRGRQEGIEKGRQEGIEKGRQEEVLNALEIILDLKFGESGKQLLDDLKGITDLNKLRAVQQALRGSQSLDEIRTLIRS